MKKKCWVVVGVLVFVILCVGLFLIFRPTAKKTLKKTYKNMQLNADKMNGYETNIGLSGVYNKKRFSTIVKVVNYMNEQLYISDFVEWNGKKAYQDLYVENGKAYDSEGYLYRENSDDLRFTHNTLFAESLNHIISIDDESKDTIRNEKQKVILVKIDKEFMNKIVDDTKVDFKIENDVQAKIYINNKNQLTRINYYLLTGENDNNLTMVVNYYDLNNTQKLQLDLKDEN